MIKRGALLIAFANFVLLLCGTAALSEAFTLPDTGQTKCYQGVSPYAEIPCSGTGQDGAYTINPMSFTDNVNGTVMDNNTGLMWQKEDDGNTYNWYQAAGVYDATYNSSSQNVCGALNLDGYGDWRLPSKKELITIVDYSFPYPGPSINMTYFPNTKSSDYWSFTTYAGTYPGYPNIAWNVRFYDGAVYFYLGSVVDSGKGYNMYVRCVRSAQQPAQQFTDNGNGTVSDSKTGLVWQQGETWMMTWPDLSIIVRILICRQAADSQTGGFQTLKSLSH
jgi:hypothetical protein